MLVQLPAGILCLIYVAVFFAVEGPPSEGFSLLVLGVVALKCALKGRADPLDFALTLGLFYLYVLPCATLTFFDNYDYVIVTAISSPVFDAFVRACRWTTLLPAGARTGERATSLEYLAWWALVGWLFLAGAVLPSGEISRQLEFNIPFALSLIVFEKVCRTGSIARVYLLLGVYFLAIMFFVNVYWGGFGRIVIGSYVLIPLFIAHYWRDIGLRVWQGVISAPFAIFLANLSRIQEQAEFWDMHSGSIAAHLVMTRDLMDQIDLSAPVGWLGYWGQWLLLSVQWFPRDVWPDKPVGVGRDYVDMGYLGGPVSEGHSVALGYIGEAIFYLGEQWVLGVVITLATLILIRRLVARVGQGYVAPILAYDVFLISYVWAGMASFGGRMAFFVLPMLAFLFARRFRIRRSEPTTSGALPLQLGPHPPRASPNSAL